MDREIRRRYFRARLELERNEISHILLARDTFFPPHRLFQDHAL